MSDPAVVVDPAAPVVAPAAAAPATPVTPAAVDPAAPAAPAVDPAKPADPAAPTGAPEAYADFKQPDGFTFDADLSAEFKATAKAMNLSQDDAQKLFDLGIKSNQSSAAKIQAMAATAKAQWQADAQADKEIGGAQAAEHRATANKALADFGTPELKKLLDESGLGDHPELLRWAYRVGKAMSNDTHVPGSKGGSKGDARSLYPNSNMNP